MGGVVGNEGFSIDVAAADLAARRDLPNLADHLAAQVPRLTGHDAIATGQGGSPSVSAAVAAYTELSDLLAARLVRASATIGQTATALADIVELYRRVDGQGQR